MYAVTGANGQLGALVIDRLLAQTPPGQVVATVRRPDDAGALRAKGVAVREADYDRPETLGPAFTGVDKLLLISSSEIGRRGPQHKAVIQAAKGAGVGLIAYTSVLHADRSPLSVAPEHRETEAALAASGLPHVLLRNGWYSENPLAALPAILQHGVVLGAAGEGRVSSAARADYADAAVAALTRDDQAGQVYELAGNGSWSLPELAAEIGRQVGRTISYQDMPQAEFAGVLRQSGLPDGLAELLADSDAGTAKGALQDESRTLSRLIGRPTTPLSQSVSEALAKHS